MASISFGEHKGIAAEAVASVFRKAAERNPGFYNWDVEMTMTYEGDYPTGNNYEVTLEDDSVSHMRNVANLYSKALDLLSEEYGEAIVSKG